MASWANIMPAIGAPKPADMAAATPHPITTSVPILILKNRFNAVLAVAPKCTNGPYWPTDALPDAEINAARVDANPVFVSNPSASWCAAYIESAGPFHFLIPNEYRTSKIKRAAKFISATTCKSILNIPKLTILYSPNRSTLFEVLTR